LIESRQNEDIGDLGREPAGFLREGKGMEENIGKS